MKRKPIDPTIEFDKLVEMTNGYSGADIAAMVNAAAMSAIKEYVVNKRGDTSTVTNKDADNKKEKLSLIVSLKHFQKDKENHKSFK
jgi:transitional endoplasmic reticulum ATPase